jgi:hypothetical protein
MEHAAMTLQRLWVWLRFQRHRQGLAAVLGLLLLAAAGAAQVLLVAPLQAQSAQLQEETSSLRRQVARQPRAAADPAARGAALLAGLPPAGEALQAIGLLHRSASAHGVVLAHGEYRVVREGSGRWLRYQVSLPARAPYPALRAWLTDVMNSVPNASLDDLGLRREDAAQADVDAQLRFTLFLRAD